MTHKRETHWGRIAFGIGLATCVLAGAAVGVILGNGKGDSGNGVSQRVAALALDTRGLNDDALALSQAIEGAIEREELEGEAEALRARLTVIEERAARIGTRARWRVVADTGGGDRVAGGVERQRARSGLAEVRSALAVFDRQVVQGFDQALASPSASTATSALAEATEVVERQGERMARLGRNLSAGRPGEGEAPDLAPGSTAAGADLAGSFQVVPSSGDEALEAEYELTGMAAEVDESEGAPEGPEVTAAASGTVNVSDPVGGPTGVTIPPLRVALLWEESALPAALRDDLSFRIEGESIAGEGEGEAESASCRYGVRGSRYCALAWFDFGDDPSGEGGGTALAPGETADLGDATAAGALRLGERATDADAEAIAELLEAGEPAIVQVFEASPEGLLRPACDSSAGSAEAGGAAAETTEAEATEAEGTELEGTEAEGAEAGVVEVEAEAGAAVAMLDGGGAVIFEAGQTPEAEGEPCYEAGGE